MDKASETALRIMERLCIYPKDIMRVTGRSERYGRSIIQKIKQQLKKEPHQLVTVDEFCRYLGLREETVLARITS